MSNTITPAYEVVGTLTREQAVAVAELLAGGSVLWDKGHTFPCDGIEIRPARPTPETVPAPEESIQKAFARSPRRISPIERGVPRHGGNCPCWECTRDQFGI